MLIDGKETGTDHLHWIFDKVKKLNLSDDAAITDMLLTRVKEFNYVPAKKLKYMQQRYSRNIKNGRFNHF